MNKEIERIEELLIKTDRGIPEVVERYGDYFYRLAKAINTHYIRKDSLPSLNIANKRR